MRRRKRAKHISKAVRTDGGVVYVQMRKRRIRLTVVMGPERWAAIDLTDEAAALLAERLDNCSFTLSKMKEKKLSSNDAQIVASFANRLLRAAKAVSGSEQ
jgi:hypothetical protein